MENQKRHQMVTDRVDFDIDDYIKNLSSQKTSTFEKS
jgi:hypothetical protein